MGLHSSLDQCDGGKNDDSAVGNEMYFRSTNYRSIRDSFTLEIYVEIYTTDIENVALE